MLEIKRREALLRKQREQHGILRLSTCSGALLLALAVCVMGWSRNAPGLGRQTPYGSILLADGVGGYVLAGILAFMVGVAVTALCIRYRTRKKNDEREQHNDEGGSEK